MSEAGVQVLDCTLRDGGYYTDWHFDDQVVADYLVTVADSPVVAVELGYRQPRDIAPSGRFAYTDDHTIDSLGVPSTLACGVMLDAKGYFGSEAHVRTVVGQLFGRCEDSRVDIVRVAVRASEVEKSLHIIEHLKRLGYQTSLSLMQAAGTELGTLTDAGGVLQRAGTLDVLYFADSFGIMSPRDVAPLVDALRASWSGPLGFHGHDNKGLALVNALECIRNGVTWIDSTVGGMGRGAGNVATEYLIQALVGGNSMESTLAFYKLVVQHFQPLRSRYGWGQNLLYHLAGNLNLHPTCVQDAIDEGGSDVDSVLSAVRTLHEMSRFSRRATEPSARAADEPQTRNG